MPTSTQTSSGTMTAIGHTVTFTPTRSPAAAFGYLQLQGVAGGQVIIETSSDGTNWVPARAKRNDNIAGNVFGAFYLPNALNQLLILPMLFNQMVRVRCTAITSGSITVRFDAPTISPAWLVAPRLGTPAGAYSAPFSILEPAIPGIPGVTAF